MTVTPTSLQSNDSSTIYSPVAAADTTIYVSAFKKWTSAGVQASSGFDSAAAFCKIVDSTGRYEYIYYAGASVNGTTFVTTLTGVIRGLDPKSASFTPGTGQVWDPGTQIYVVDYPELWNSTAKLDDPNSFTDNQTIASGKALYLGGGTTAYIKSTDSGTNMKFKDGSNSEVTLSQITAQAGLDVKVKVSATDTTAEYLLTKIPSGNGVTMTQTGGGGDETLVPSINLDTNPGLQLSANKLSVLSSVNPTGVVSMWAAAAAPTGWLLCDGTSYSTLTTYAALYAVIGTTYGTSGANTFKVPDLRANVPVGYKAADGNFGTLGGVGGEATHTLSAAESGLPAHTHVEQSFSGGSGGNPGLQPSANAYVTSAQSLTITTAANSAAAASNAHNNLQPYITLNFIIKI